MLASLHMNAVPFYVMVVVVLFLGESWNWWQAAGAALVAVGVLLAQSATRRQ
jgi:drug/metabolite transporter (DMT)-like permease